MIYHFLAPEGGHPTWEKNNILKKKNTVVQGPFFQATPVNLINESNEMLFKKIQQRYTRLINKIYFLGLLLTNHETPYN